jgi:DNA-binding MarR family transcriptional regulator
MKKIVNNQHVTDISRGETRHRWHDAVPDDRLAHLIREATRLLVRSLQARLQQHDVSFGHWAFLRILWEQDGLSQRQLSEAAGVMEPTTHAALHAMEQRGYVERRRQAGDLRNQHVFLTTSGRRLKRVLVPLAIEVNEVAVQGLPREDLATMRRVLHTIIGNLGAETLPAKLPATTLPAKSTTRASTTRVGRKSTRSRKDQTAY